jgi:hypothetical protein
MDALREVYTREAATFVRIPLMRSQRRTPPPDEDDEERPLRIEVVERECERVFWDDLSIVKEMKNAVPEVARDNPYLAQLLAADVLKRSKRRLPVTKKTATQ